MNIACAICLEPITLKCNVSATSCGHLFHTNCIHEWLSTDKWANITKGISKSCPQCRNKCDYLTKLYFNEDIEVESKIDKLEEKSGKLVSEVAKLQDEKKMLEEKVDELGAVH